MTKGDKTEEEIKGMLSGSDQRNKELKKGRDS
jgi:hypothetical protein